MNSSTVKHSSFAR